MRPRNSLKKTDSDVLGKGNMNRNLERKPTGNTFNEALAKRMKKDDIFTSDIIIAVVGPTGSGKSSFINTINNLETGTGHDSESGTSKVNDIRFSIPEMAFGDLVFVDTPGFDDTLIKDVDILKMVADWLKSTYEKNIFLSGLLYFHRITDNRMVGTPLKNLRMFEELCGKNAFQNVILTTTMWDEVDEETGKDRERELKTNHWRTMLDRNSTTSRFLRTRESAFNLIDPLIEAANERSSILLQNELVDMHKSLPATTAGLELFSTMGELVSQREDLLRRIRFEVGHSDSDKMSVKPLQEEHQTLQKNLEETVIEMRRLQLPLGQRLLIMTDKFFSSKFESLCESPISEESIEAEFHRKIADVIKKASRNESLERKPTGNSQRTFFNIALAKRMKKNSVLSPNDIIIAVVGPAGSGKTSFINTIIGLETGMECVDSESCTSKVSSVRFSIPEIAFGDLVFVDTPGFDDTLIKEVDILKDLADWLKTTYEKNTLLSGLLYFHRITDSRMVGTPLKNLRMFEELCGKNAIQNVILTTTMWDKVDEETGKDRERELKSESKYWRTMLDRSSTTSPFLRTRESAFHLIDPLIEAANKRSSNLLQDELVVMRKSLPATTAGLEVFSKMAQLVRQLEYLLRQIRLEIRRSDGDKKNLERFQEKHLKLQNSLEATVFDMRKLPLEQRLLIMTDKFFSTKFDHLKSLTSKKLAPPNLTLPNLPIDSYGSISFADLQVAEDLLPTGDPIDLAHQSRGSTSHAPYPIANSSNVLLLGQGPTIDTDRSPSKPTKHDEKWSQTIHSSLITTKEQVQVNTVSSDESDTDSKSPPLYEPVSDADHLPTGAISKNPNDYIHQSPPGYTSHTPLQSAESSNTVLPRAKGPTSGTVPKDRFKPPPRLQRPPYRANATRHDKTRAVLQGTITSLQLIQNIVGLAPVPGLQSLVGMVLQISRVVENMYATEEALVELAQKAGSFMLTLVSLQRSPICDHDSMNSVIQGLTKEMRRVLRVVNEISSRKLAKRTLLTFADKGAIDECNRQIALACGIFGIQIAFTSQEAIARVEEKLNLALNIIQESNKQPETAIAE